MKVDQEISVLDPVDPRWPTRQDEDRTGFAVAAGMAAALVGGLIWAGIVLATHLEIGWAAWGVGVLVGGAMAGITVRRSQRLGLTAAGLAATGLLVGKLVITLGSAGAITEDLLRDPDYLQGSVAWQMFEAEELEPATQRGVEATLQAGDTLSDAIWADMLRQAESRISRMTEDELRLVARATARGYISQLGIVDGVLVQLGPWDLLWFGLALFTAFRMMAAAKEELPANV